MTFIELANVLDIGDGLDFILTEKPQPLAVQEQLYVASCLADATDIAILPPERASSDGGCV